MPKKNDKSKNKKKAGVSKKKPVKVVVKKAVAGKPAAKKLVAKKATVKPMAKKAPVKKTQPPSPKGKKKVIHAPVAVKKATKPEAKPIAPPVKPARTVKPEKEKKAPAPVADKVETLPDVSEDLEELEAASAEDTEEEVVLTDAEGRRYCRVKDCDQLAVVDGYCRYHYLLYWKKIQIRKKILSEGKLERYIEELTARYPDKFLDMLRKDLRSEKEFLAAIQELEIDESAVDNEFEDEAQTYIDEVRGMGEGGTREEEDF
ncbi:MAG: hypothetical protein HC902_02865 [Calothrix sp. SM1_5_4]|nr:hypothetical protein [Calothrix sp. SM1_5_4]